MNATGFRWTPRHSAASPQPDLSTIETQRCREDPPGINESRRTRSLREPIGIGDAGCLQARVACRASRGREAILRARRLGASAVNLLAARKEIRRYPQSVHATARICAAGAAGFRCNQRRAKSPSSETALPRRGPRGPDRAVSNLELWTSGCEAGPQVFLRVSAPLRQHKTSFFRFRSRIDKHRT